ncbi:MAG: Nif3-like dinuclear metal center hexameric protein [Anaerolineae bacterium]
MTLQTAPRALDEVKAYLDELLQVQALDPASNGLVIEGPPQVNKVGLAVNCSLQAIQGAAQRHCELLITHHGASASTDAHLADTKYERLRQLGISLYVVHECLDIVPGFGTAGALARGVRVAVQGPFQPDGQSAFGVHGMTTGQFDEFVTRVGGQLGTEPRAWKNNQSFGHIAVVAGWGGRPEWMARAHALGCDTFLTGEALMFGLLFAREVGLNLVLAGHYATKTPGVLALSTRIARDLQMDVTFIPEEVIEARAKGI